ncbi:MAG: hypothetical protein HYX27_00470 [Acidobacteria bacterium]|nr:hypothetical protein [Acidobacteriota bacterium]
MLSLATFVVRGLARRAGPLLIGANCCFCAVIWSHPDVLASLPAPVVNTGVLFSDDLAPQMQSEFPQYSIWNTGSIVGYFGFEWRAPIWTTIVVDPPTFHDDGEDLDSIIRSIFSPLIPAGQGPNPPGPPAPFIPSSDPPSSNDPPPSNPSNDPPGQNNSTPPLNSDPPTGGPGNPSVSLDAAAVPEPSAWILSLLGLLAAGGLQVLGRRGRPSAGNE